LNCAGGQTLPMLVTFMPGEAIPDLVAVDVVLDVQLYVSDLSAAPFWEFAVANPGGLAVTHVRPSNGCNNYAFVWTEAIAGSGLNATQRTPTTERVLALAYTSAIHAVTRNQRVFGLEFAIDGATAAESGGTESGCVNHVSFDLNNVIPRTVSGNPTTELISASVFGSTADVFGEVAVASRRATWGSLKSLYR
jgi:hypothetical protein